MMKRRSVIGVVCGILIVLCIFCGVFHTHEREKKEAVARQRGSFVEKIYENKPVKKETAQLQLHAQAAAIMDGVSERVLYEKNGDKETAMASTTKIMTCMVVLEHADLEDIVCVSQNAARQPDVKMHVKTGEQYYVGDLLYALMLESYNDVAVALAEQVGGSVEGFAKLMNEKAAELGCVHTQFVTPNGLDASGHYTTAKELCKIAAYAIQNETFLAITNTAQHSFGELTTNRTFTVHNKDRFLQLYEGAIGVKTGFTGKAGYCFVGAVKKNGKTFVSAVLGSGWPPNKNYKWQDTMALMEYGEKTFSLQEIFEDRVKIPDFCVHGKRKKKLSVFYDKTEEKMLLDGSELQQVFLEQYAVCAPVKKGSCVGKLYFLLDKKVIWVLPVYAKHTISNPDYLHFLRKVSERWWF